MLFTDILKKVPLEQREERKKRVQKIKNLLKKWFKESIEAYKKN